MSAAEQNRAIVEAGLSKRKAAKQAQEQEHEAMRREMFEIISINYEDACLRESKNSAHEAQKAARRQFRQELSNLIKERDAGLRRVFGALGAAAAASLLLALDGISLWVAIIVYGIALVVMVWEFLQAAKRAPAIKEAYTRKVEADERI